MDWSNSSAHRECPWSFYLFCAKTPSQTFVRQLSRTRPGLRTAANLNRTSICAWTEPTEHIFAFPRLLDTIQDPPFEAAHAAKHILMVSLTKFLPKKLIIVRKDLYPNYREFVQAIRCHGGMLEVIPNLITGCPSANIFVPPTGAPQLLSTHEQVT